MPEYTPSPRRKRRAVSVEQIAARLDAEHLRMVIRAHNAMINATSTCDHLREYHRETVAALMDHAAERETDALWRMRFEPAPPPIPFGITDDDDER